jgi:trans-aconitate methyltransferase
MVSAPSSTAVQSSYSGCGEGALLEILLNDTHYDSVAGIDVDEEVLALAAERYLELMRCQPTRYDYEYLRELPVTLNLYQGTCI